MLKLYFIPVKAARITRKNYEDLKKIDTCDGVLSEGTIEDFEGDWFVVTVAGNEVMAGNRLLVPANEK